IKVYVTLCLILCVYLHEALVESDSDAILEDKDVLVLTNSNFKRALKPHNQLLVHFYVPLSGQSLGAILEVREAAGALKEAESDVRLGGVDVKKEKDLAASLNVTIIPSLQLFLSGDKNNPVYCPGNSSASIIMWLKRRKGPSADIIILMMILILYTLKDLEEGIVKVFYETAADIADLPFGVTGHDEIFSNYEISGDTVLLIRKFEMKSGIMTYSRCIKINKPLSFMGSFQTASKILNSEVLNHFLFINKTEEGFEEIYQAFKTTVGKLRGKVLSVMIDLSELLNGRVMEYFCVRSEEAPQVRMVNLSDNFCLSYLDEKAKVKKYSSIKLFPAVYSERVSSLLHLTVLTYLRFKIPY
uniref:Zgc:136472 n=1 Tax=Cyprinus carpio TaxID=7962 RepID=A0A8C1SD95_CYPCA